MKKLILPLLALGLQVATAQQAAPTVGTSLDTIYKQAKEPFVASQDSKEPAAGVPFTTDTQIRFLSLIEPATNKEILHVSETKPKEADTYLTVENVPLKTLFHLLALRSGLNYLEPDNDLPNMDETISLEMKDPKPRELMDWLLKHRNFELYDGGTGIYTIRRYTNQMSFYKFKLTDNFIDQFKGSAQSSGGGVSGGGGYGGGGSGGGNAVSASHSFTVQNGGKYGDIEGLLEKVANTGGDGEKSKIWYFDEKQRVLMYGTRPASERVATYLEIANMKNPNIRIDVRIYATDNNPQSQLGVDWSSMLTPGLTFGIQPPGTSINSTSSTTSTGGTNSSAFPTFNSLAGLVSSFGHPGSALVMQNQLQATLNFFVNETRAEAITEPSSITANDREVAFAATQQIPYVSGSEVAGNGYGTSSSSGYNQTAFVNVGATINILPRIQDGHRLKLGTAISISQLDQMITISSGSAGSAPEQVPQTSGRAFNGEFTINSGDTVVIAGMKTHTTSKTINKVPLFGDIPGIGKLFRNSSDSKNNAYLTIFITATILDDENNPRIPEGHVTPKDKYPDDDNTWLSAEPNSQNLARSGFFNDKSLINARREALDLRTDQANRIIAQRMQQEEKLQELNNSLGDKDEEVKEIEAEQKKLSKSHDTAEGSIEGIRSETALHLVKAKAERDQITKDLQSCKDDLEKLVTKETEATKAKEKAEDDYSKTLKDTVITQPNAGVKDTNAPPPGVGTGINPVQTQEINKALDANKQQLNNL